MKAITDLTVEELALVQAAHEKAEQEKAAKQAQLEKQIEERRATATAAQLVGEKQVKATYDYFSQFNTVGEFEVVEYPLNREIIIKDSNEILFKEDYVINSAYIKHIESGRKIRVDEHIIYSEWGRSKNNGYKMFIGFEARAYKNVSTIETKLLNEINSKRAKQNAEEIRNTYIADLIETQPIPNAKIAKAYISSNYVTSPYGLEIQYSNGSLVTCSINVTEKGEAILSVFKTEFPKPKIEGDTVMDKLQFISKLEF